MIKIILVVGELIIMLIQENFGVIVQFGSVSAIRKIMPK